MATRSISMTEVAERIEAKTGVKKNLTRNVVKALIEVASEEIAAGNPFSLTGFVKFSHRYRPALKKGRMVRNPQTGEVSKAPEGRAASITVGARALRTMQQAAPTPTSRAGKPIAEAAKERLAAAAERKAEREAQA